MASEINWFPGHMTKALRTMTEQIKNVDMVIETCDARIPISSRNPELNSILQNRRRLLVLNKADLAEDSATEEWISWYREQGIIAIPSDASHRKGLDRIRLASRELCADVLKRAHDRGRIGRPIRAMVVGIPNSGKSTLINALCNRKIAVTGDRPGVTRGFQWAKSDSSMELMDMPGVLWPNLGSRRNQICLTITGAVKPEIVDMTSFAYDGLNLLMKLYPKETSARYLLALPGTPGYVEDAYERFLLAAKNRGCILSGGRIDEERFSVLFLDDFKSGRIGKMTLERPEKPGTEKAANHEHT